MKIAVDSMGGDYNIPDINIEGALLAIKESEDLEIKLIGPIKKLEESLNKYTKKYKNFINKIELVNSEEVISMDEQPSKVLRSKQNSSIAIGIKLLKEKVVEGFVSAGNSGSILAFALTYIGTIENINRPAIATVFPTYLTPCVILDVGANVDCKPAQLVEFAYMGKIYCESLLGKSNPKIALLSIGTENSKGNAQVLETFTLLKNEKDLNFIGNIEGKDIPFGVADVILTDGFVGNIILKFGEGISEMLLNLIKQSLKRHPFALLSIPFVWNAIRDLRKKVDFSEYGGAPLLGLKNVCIISHGRSNSKAIKNAIKLAKNMVEKRIPDIISANIKGKNL